MFLIIISQKTEIIYQLQLQPKHQQKQEIIVTKKKGPKIETFKYF